MADLAQLQHDYEVTLETYRNDPSEENYADYKNAADAFAKARTKQKKLEEGDPNHPRGNVFASTTLKEN